MLNHFPCSLIYLHYVGICTQQLFSNVIAALLPCHYQNTAVTSYGTCGSVLAQHQFLRMAEELDPYLGRVTCRSHAFSNQTQLLLALRFYTSGSLQNVLTDLMGLRQVTISRVITQVTQVLYEKERREIKMPRCPEELACESFFFFFSIY